jgi:fatty acid/phospholipid biosynthesis enzyme
VVKCGLSQLRNDEKFQETMIALNKAIEGYIESVTITSPDVDVILTAGFLQNSLITITK